MAERPSSSDLDTCTIATHHGYHARAAAVDGLSRVSLGSSRCALTAVLPRSLAMAVEALPRPTEANSEW